MIDDDAERAFWGELARNPERPTPARLVSRALELGISPARAITLSCGYHGSRLARAAGGLAPVQTLVSLLMGPPGKGVLEYSASDQWLSLAGGAERGADLTLVAPYEEMAQVLRIAQPQARVRVSQLTAQPSAHDLGKHELFVYSPPIGGLPKGNADGFGGEVFRQFVTQLGDGGRALWLTTRGALLMPRADRTREALAKEGWSLEAMLDVIPGSIAGSSIEAVLFCYCKAPIDQRLVGALRDEPTASDIASALLMGPSRKSGSNWTWVPATGLMTYRDIERERLFTSLRPKGRSAPTALGDLMRPGPILKADRAPANDGAAIFVPEYAQSRVTATLEDQTVKPTAVYRLPIDEAKVSPPFLAHLLNSPLGRELRASISAGTTIVRVSPKGLLELVLPIPERSAQDGIIRALNDISLLASTLNDLGSDLVGDWSVASQTQERIDRLLGVLDLNKQIADWWRELPYPLATVYRRFRVERSPKEKLDALLHFFELAAIYLAAVGASHVKALRVGWAETLGRWLHPSSGVGIERTDFGFWTTVAAAGLKDLKRIASEKELRETAVELAGPQAVQIALSIGGLSPMVEVLDEARTYRNRLKGHGGHIKESDAARFVEELEPLVRRLYEHGGSTFRALSLVRPGSLEATDDGLRYSIQKLVGSDPTFDRETIEVDAIIKSHTLAFWYAGSRRMCPAIPFMRIGAPQRPHENTCYVYNRSEPGGVRWVSYQEAGEQEFTAPDDEMQAILDIGRQGGD